MAEDAIAKAKAIAAKLRATSAPLPYYSGGGASDSDPSAPGAKRKRWSSSADAADPSYSRARTDDDHVTRRVEIPAEKNPGYNYVGLLIGPGGSKQRALQAESGGRVRIQVRGVDASADSDDSLHVLLEGTRECVDKAESLIKELLEDTAKADAEKQRQLESLGISSVGGGSSGGGGGSSTYKPMPVAQLIHGSSGGGMGGIYGPASATSMLEESMSIPNGVVGFVIGKGGESITSMQRRTGCRVQIQKEHEMAAGTNVRVITLSAAQQEQIDACRAIIEGMVDERHKANNGSGGRSSGVEQVREAVAHGHKVVTVAVPDADVGLVIGKGGISIRSIQDRSGANVQIPTQADADNPMIRTCQITHPTEEGANFAKQLVEEILRNKVGNWRGNMGPVTAEHSVQITIPDKDVGMIIGKSGCVIREMQSKTRTRIQIPPIPGQLNRVVTVTGSPEGCQQVKQMIEMIILEQSSQSVMTGTNFTGGFTNPTGQYGAHGAANSHDPYTAYGRQPYGNGAAGQTNPYAAASHYGAQQNYAQAPAAAAGGQNDYAAEWAAYYARMGQQAPAGSATATAATTAATAATATTTAETPTDPKAYYDAFFRYAAHYGEEPARAYYGQWSPPAGTPNPYQQGAAAPSASSADASAPAPAPAAQDASTDAAANNVLESNRVADETKNTVVRNVSNLPAWMTERSNQ